MNKIITLICLLLACNVSVKAQNVERYKTYHDKGRLLILEGKYKEAIIQLDTAINIMPYYARIFQDRGYAYMQLKNYEAALRDFDHILEKQPYLNEVKLQKGMALYHLNYIDDAERNLLSIKKARPDKNFEAEYYLESINKEKKLRYEKHQKLDVLKHQAQLRKLEKDIHRNDIIWDTEYYQIEKINKERELFRYEKERINELRYLTEAQRLKRAKHREDVIWNTIVPLAFWSSVFLTW